MRNRIKTKCRLRGEALLYEDWRSLVRASDYRGMSRKHHRVIKEWKRWKCSHERQLVIYELRIAAPND